MDECPCNDASSAHPTDADRQFPPPPPPLIAFDKKTRCGPSEEYKIEGTGGRGAPDGSDASTQRCEHLRVVTIVVVGVVLVITATSYASIQD